MNKYKYERKSFPERLYSFIMYAIILTGLTGWIFCSSVIASPKTAILGQNVHSPLYGEPISENALNGKVVFLEYWGTHCPPCRASLPKLVEMQKHFGKKYLIVLGSHMQPKSEETIKLLDDCGCNFTVFQQMISPVAPPEGGGIPQAYIIDHTGKLVESGHPMELAGKVARYVEEAKSVISPVFLPFFNPLSEINIKPKFKGIKNSFRYDKAWSKPMQKLRSMAENKNKPDQDASEMLEDIISACETEINEIASFSRKRPTEAFLRFSQLEKNLKGTSMEELLTEKMAFLKKSKQVQALAKLWNETVEILIQAEKSKSITINKRAEGLYSRLESFLTKKPSPVVITEAKKLMDELEKKFSLSKTEKLTP